MQLLKADEGRLQVTDGKSRVYLNYDQEDCTIEGLLTLLESQGLSKSKDCLENAKLWFPEASFACFLKPNKFSEKEQDLVISLEIPEISDIKILSTGEDNERPAGTLYLGVELGKTKVESIKSQIIAKTETISSVGKLSGAEVTDLISSLGMNTKHHGHIGGDTKTLQDDDDDPLPEIGEGAEITGLSLLGTDWNNLSDQDPLILPEMTDELWLKFDPVKNSFKTKTSGVICESLEDFVTKSTRILTQCANLRLNLLKSLGRASSKGGRNRVSKPAPVQ